MKIGDYLFYGDVTTKDTAAAAIEYRTAADASNPQAMFNLGWMHEYGIGLPADLHLAKRYYDSAAETSSDASLPTTLALGVLSVKIWLRENVPGDFLTAIGIFPDESGTTRDLMAILDSFEDVLIGVLVTVLFVVMLARQMQYAAVAEMAAAAERESATASEQEVAVAEDQAATDESGRDVAAEGDREGGPVQ